MLSDLSSHSKHGKFSTWVHQLWYPEPPKASLLVLIRKFMAIMASALESSLCAGFSSRLHLETASSDVLIWKLQVGATERLTGNRHELQMGPKPWWPQPSQYESRCLSGTDSPMDHAVDWRQSCRGHRRFVWTNLCRKRLSNLGWTQFFALKSQNGCFSTFSATNPG